MLLFFASLLPGTHNNLVLELAMTEILWSGMTDDLFFFGERPGEKSDINVKDISYVGSYETI